MFKFTRDIAISVNLLNMLTDQPIKTTVVAEKCGTSVHMMNLITSKLRRAGLVKTQKGRNGGISSTQKFISLFDVINAFYADPSDILTTARDSASRLNNTLIDFYRALPITGIPDTTLDSLKRHEELVGDDEYTGEEIIFETDFDLPQNKAELSEGVTARRTDGSLWEVVTADSEVIPDYVQPIVVSPEAFEQLQKELENPSEPSETLKEAMKEIEGEEDEELSWD